MNISIRNDEEGTYGKLWQGLEGFLSPDHPPSTIQIVTYRHARCQLRSFDWFRATSVDISRPGAAREVSLFASLSPVLYKPFLLGDGACLLSLSLSLPLVIALITVIFISIYWSCFLLTTTIIDLALNDHVFSDTFRLFSCIFLFPCSLSCLCCGRCRRCAELERLSVWAADPWQPVQLVPVLNQPTISTASSIHLPVMRHLRLVMVLVIDRKPWSMSLTSSSAAWKRSIGLAAVSNFFFGEIGAVAEN